MTRAQIERLDRMEREIGAVAGRLQRGTVPDALIVEGLALEVVVLLEKHGYLLPSDNRRYRMMAQITSVTAQLVEVFDGPEGRS